MAEEAQVPARARGVRACVQVTVHLRLPVHCEEKFNLQRFLWRMGAADAAVTAAGRHWCASEGLTLVEGSVEMIAPPGV